MKWFHLIGVCGKTTANIAKVFQDMGWFVTGSDTQFLPPASKLLQDFNINTVEGYDYEHLTKPFWEQKLARTIEVGDTPDLVLTISYLTPKNKEYLFAKKKNLNVKPYAQILAEYLIKPESIVVVGTAGKTTTTAFITYLLQNLEEDPSYMIGAEVVNIPDSLKITDSKYSVIEGDEYHNPDPEIEGKAKFLEYKPKYLIITSIGWEHQDIFPTQESYIAEFAKAVQLVPADGLIIAHAGDANIDKALAGAKAKVIRYGLDQKGLWNVKKSESLNTIADENGKDVLSFQTSLLGDYNFENILAGTILIKTLFPDVEGSKLTELIANFKGVKKRLEVLREDEKLVVVDDFGVAPERAKNSLKTLKENFSQYKIYAVFEPNAGSRIKDLETFNQLYKDSFQDASEVIIPDLSSANPELATAEDMTSRLSNLGFSTKYIPSSELLNYLSELKNSNEKLLVVFFSSYRLTELAEQFAH